MCVMCPVLRLCPQHRRAHDLNISARARRVCSSARATRVREWWVQLYIFIILPCAIEWFCRKKKWYIPEVYPQIFLCQSELAASRFCRSCQFYFQSCHLMITWWPQEDGVKYLNISKSLKKGYLLGHVLPRHKFTSLYWRECRPLEYCKSFSYLNSFNYIGISLSKISAKEDSRWKACFLSYCLCLIWHL